MAIQTVTVVGSGNMGSGIAQSFASAGFQVTLNDVSSEAVQKGIERIRKPLEKRVAEGKMPKADLDALLARLLPEPDLAKAVAKADLVVEAVFEDLKVKQDLFRKLDQLVPAQCLLATNTSSFTVADLAGVTKQPGRVLGLHFFFPAAINKLVEVVKGPATDGAAFTATYAAVKRSGKVPIETADAPGFAVNRFFVPWVNEACRMLDEGFADIPTIEAVAKHAFGITMGPFELMNVTGVPISLHAQTTLYRKLGAFYEPAKSLVAQVDKKTNWDLAGEPNRPIGASVASRLRAVVFGIACHLVEEKVATMRDIDRGATIGLRWKNGPFTMMNAMEPFSGIPENKIVPPGASLRGPARAAEEVRAIAQAWGKDFPMPANLEAHAKAGTSWHLPAVNLESIDGDRIALITFDRPEALNALDPRVLRDLDDVLTHLQAGAKKGSPPRAIVVTGEGKAFIAGADIPTMRAMSVPEARAYTELGNRVIDRLAASPCPVLMAINGFAFGGGLELALAGDLLYASEKAQLGLPEVGLGIHPGFGGTQRLPRRIGLGAAKDLVLTGRTLSAKEAYAIGLVNAVLPADQLMEHVLSVARTIAQKAPLAVAGAKASLDHGLEADLPRGLAIEQDSVVLLFATADKKEGLDAFVERRSPVFVGR